MKTAELAPGLSGMACEACAGTWIPRSHYDSWRARQPADMPETELALQETVAETHRAKTCPQCGRLLLPYRVGHGLSFRIDYCGSCGGLWLDRGEWDAIKARNLHDNLHEIVSAHWQAAIRQVQVQDAVEQNYRRLLGPAYDKAREIRAWLGDQPQKSLILAYLSGEKADGE